MTKTTSPRLTVIDPSSSAPEPLPPPSGLDEVGAELWHAIMSEYLFGDPGSIEVLRLACLARQRAARCAAQIAADGELLRAGKLVRGHPLLRDEVAFTALCARLLKQLGLDLEPVRPTPGRPPGR